MLLFIPEDSIFQLGQTFDFLACSLNVASVNWWADQIIIFLKDNAKGTFCSSDTETSVHSYSTEISCLCSVLSFHMCSTYTRMCTYTKRDFSVKTGNTHTHTHTVTHKKQRYSCFSFLSLPPHTQLTTFKLSFQTNYFLPQRGDICGTTPQVCVQLHK